MLQFMVVCLFAAVFLIGLGAAWAPLAWLGLVVGALFFAAPFTYIAWHVLSPPRAD